MARKIKPCEMCAEDSPAWEHIVKKNGFEMWAEIYPYNNIMTVTCFAKDENGLQQKDYIEFPMNYCPRCGRKLE